MIEQLVTTGLSIKKNVPGSRIKPQFEGGVLEIPEVIAARYEAAAKQGGIDANVNSGTLPGVVPDIHSGLCDEHEDRH